MSKFEVSDAVHSLRLLKEKQREIEEAITDLENSLKEEMLHRQENELRGDDFFITWKLYPQRRLDSKSMRDCFPTLCERYTVTTEVRRFILR